MRKSIRLLVLSSALAVVIPLYAGLAQELFVNYSFGFRPSRTVTSE